MVGDNYQADVVGAKQAGLRAIWYNTAMSPGPINSSLHDAEIQTMSELPATLGILILHEMDGC
jgi:FMN phosphatase YigB (HAD superfamily)